jgi:shikimate kinase
MTKFVLIGLPGAGKTTILTEHVKLLNKQGVKANLIITDDLINKRIKEILPETSNAANPSQIFINIYGIEKLCDLEASLLINIINSSQENDWLDLGGRAPLLPGVAEALKAKGIILILLDAKHETILERLRKDGELQKRPTYKDAAEKSADGMGWIANAERHRDERLEKYRQSATITITVERSSSNQEEKELTALSKPPEEILAEIYESIPLNAHNPANSNRTKFFKEGASEQSVGNPQQPKLTARL